MPRNLIVAACLVVLAAPLATAAETPVTGNVELVLAGAASSGDDHRTDLTLEFPVREGRWAETCRGRTFRMNQGRHVGTVTASTMENLGGTMTVHVDVRRDYWGQGGRGHYDLTLKPGPDGEGLVGTYTGTFTVTEAPQPLAPRRGPPPSKDSKIPPALRKALGKEIAKEPVKTEAKDVETVDVAGEVRGIVIPNWPGRVDDFDPVQPGEHPRLIFRKSDLAEMKRRAEATPEGKAILARAMAVLDTKGPSQSDKFSLWPATGYGFAYHMTGKAEYAEKARAVVEQYLRPSGGQDIHHGPRLLGLALAYDLAGDGWDKAFSLQVAAEIKQRTLECATGTFGGRTMGGFNPNWWSNHNGIRSAAAGIGALAILGDPLPDGDTFDEAREIADQMAWEVRGFIRDGCGGGAWHMEGMFYKGMTMRRGLLHMIHAYPKVTGLTITPPGYGDWIIAGYFLEATPGKLFPQAEKWDGCGQDMNIDGTPLPAIVWSLGFAAVPDGLMPGVKTLFDRSVGLEGDKTFGITTGFYAPYVMASYPFDVEAKAPNESFPWLSPDPRNGHWVIRPVWKDEQDILMTLNLASRALGGCHHERIGPQSLWRLWGFGETWLDGIYLPRVEGKDAISDKHGPKTLKWHARDRILVLNLDTTPAYLPGLDRKKMGKRSWDEFAKAEGGLGAYFLPNWGPGLLDTGVRATRHMAVDCTGVSGAPLLVVLVEKVGVKPSLEADPEPAAVNWWLPFAGGGEVAVDGHRFSVARGKATLSGVVLGTGELNAKTVSAQSPDGRVLAVFALKDGEPPEIRVEGQGLDATVTVGDRTVRFTGETLRLE